MNVQFHGAAGADAARGASGPKPAGKAGAFQALLSTLLASLKKGASSGGEAAKGEAREVPKKSPTALAPSKEGKQPFPPVQGGEARIALGKKTAGEALEAQISAKNAKEGQTPAKSERKAPKRALPDEMASSARNRDMVASTLMNAADAKAAVKAGEKAKEGQKADAAVESAASPGKKGRIDLLDARKAARKAAQRAEGAEADRSAEAALKAEASEGPMAGKESGTGASEHQMTIDLGPDGARSGKGPTIKGESGGTGFAARLAESLRDGYNAEIVKHSAVILRADDSGLIRLNLKPESLGNVKVRLNLADNTITGTIIVESEAAKDAFEANIEHLAKSFVDSGFQDAKLQVSVDSGSGGGTGAQARREAPPDYRGAAKVLDAAVPLAGSPGDYRGRPGGLSVFA